MTEEEWKTFEDACKERVCLDNEQLKIESVYVPYAKLCDKAEYCLVLMEPGADELLKVQDKEYLSFGYWHINYCAYKYLCGSEYKYRITDISKGALLNKIANDTRRKRFENWMPLFKKEMELFGNPKIIAVGQAVHNILKKNKQKYKLNYNDDYIIHPSKRNDDLIKEEYSFIKEYMKQRKLEFDSGRPECETWRKFVKELMTMCKWPEELQIKRENGESDMQFCIEYGKVARFALYKWNFESLVDKKIGRILHGKEEKK